jgi:hypothetical protein
MKKLYTLATKLHQANYVVTDEIRNEFEEYLSIVTEGSRIIHPRFGVGTVLNAVGETWVKVEFDKEIKTHEFKKEHAINNTGHYHYSRPYRVVQITSCTSIHMLLKNEMKRDIFNK